MDLLDKLKLFRDELNLLIEAEEKKRPYQSEVGKSFQEKVKQRMEMKSVWDEPFRINAEDLKKFFGRNNRGGTKIQDEL